MNRSVSVFILALFAWKSASSDELRVDGQYRLKANSVVRKSNPIINGEADAAGAAPAAVAASASPTTTAGTEDMFRVGGESKFVVVSNEEDSVPAIRFTKLYKIWDEKNKEYKKIEVDQKEVYYYSKEDNNSVALPSISQSAQGGLVSGPLVVPFKFRVNDNSLDGDAAVGYYAGFGVDTDLGDWLDRKLVFSPIVSFGLSQVSVTTGVGEDLEEDSRSAFTWAAGLLIQNWDKVNIGLLYGQDRTGVKEWQHEGKGWISFSVGWQIE